MHKKIAHTLALTVLAAGITLPAIAKPITFQIKDKDNRDVVSFTSDAPIELIVGHTSKIDGKVVIDQTLDLRKQPLQAEFNVDLASIDTGIPLRNEHMRDNFLETAKYPNATFKLTSLESKPVVLAANKPTVIKALGQFSLHGKTVTKHIPVTVTYLKTCSTTKENETKMPGCDLLQVKTEFPVAFKDHDIKRPQVVFQKLADTVFVKVAATAWYKPEGAVDAKKVSKN